MKRSIGRAACVLFVAAWSLTAAAVPAKDPGLAYTGIKPGEGITEGEAATADEVVIEALGRTCPFRVIGASEIKSVIGFESQRQLLGCDASSCIAELAGALGVKYLATASLGRIAGESVVGLKIIRVDNATVVARATSKVPKGAPLVETIEKMVGVVVASAASTEPMFAPTPSKQGAPERLRWPWFVGAGAALAAGVVLDNVPASSHDYQVTLVDFVPILFYGASAVLVWKGL